MKIFFTILRVTPSDISKYYMDIEGADIHCWISDNDPQSALRKAVYFVKKYDWEIKEIINFPTAVEEENFMGKDIGLEQYKKAKEQGDALVISAWAKDGKTSKDLEVLKLSNQSNLHSYLSEYKKLRNKGRCFHPDSGVNCNSIIDAHSIQKNGSLATIAENGKVYVISSDIGDLKKNKGRLGITKKGINNVSTFRGFCGYHDNQLFEPIDNFSLIPTDQQIFLYSYRSLCKNLFVEENALDIVEYQLSNSSHSKADFEILSAFQYGKLNALNNLRIHKNQYDLSLRNESYDDFKSVLFISYQKPSVVFSGVFYPDRDFMGRQLQDLIHGESTLDLITICSAPMDSGWGFLFSWHKSSSRACVEFMRSFYDNGYNNGILSDLLFRLVISNCENLAISPSWWESLPQEHKEYISERANVDIFAVPNTKYLMEGLEGIAQWNFEHIISTMET